MWVESCAPPSSSGHTWTNFYIFVTFKFLHATNYYILVTFSFVHATNYYIFITFSFVHPTNYYIFVSFSFVHATNYYIFVPVFFHGWGKHLDKEILVVTICDSGIGITWVQVFRLPMLHQDKDRWKCTMFTNEIYLSVWSGNKILPINTR